MKERVLWALVAGAWRRCRVLHESGTFGAAHVCAPGTAIVLLEEPIEVRGLVVRSWPVDIRDLGLAAMLRG